MKADHLETVSREQDIEKWQVQAVAQLLEQDATVPFIARYRKEATGSLDEVAICCVRDRLRQLVELETRREAVLKSLEKHGHLDAALAQQVEQAQTLSALEDIYLPFRPKRRTRAMAAREKGLAPLADILMAQKGIDPEAAAEKFVEPAVGAADAAAALAGARDIIAETVNEDPAVRSRLRVLFSEQGVLKSRVASGREAAAAKYRDYFDWDEPAAAAPSHRILAIRRGEREDFLNVSIAAPEETALALLEDAFVTGGGGDSGQVRTAVHDAYKRLLSRSMETEARLAAKTRADTAAIRVFADNLRQLLLAPPLGAKRVMAVDPGLRTGCKVVCLDAQGGLTAYDTIYPHAAGAAKTALAADTLAGLVENHRIEAVAVGNGTAGRETEAFVRNIAALKALPVVMVNESGASVYSASDAARAEFPDLDVTFRGAVSIGRRLMDPLSELVKIDPKSIGVGQYQHDVDPAALQQALDDVVVSCVNAVGVDVNRASSQLLSYVSGLGPALAANIVAYRDVKGSFQTREDLKKVPRLGPKAFEQAAGFLRIPGGANPLDASGVHPERYPIVERMAADAGCRVEDLIGNARHIDRIDISRYISGDVGAPTLNDILAELVKPGRDLRKIFEPFQFAEGIHKMEDLTVGERLPGVVTNLTAFGAFVDIGVHQDGLVHISQLADRFVKDPGEVLQVHQKVRVTVLDVDLDRRRIALSLKTPASRRRKKKPATAKPTAERKPQPLHNPFADAFRRGS